MEINGRNYHDPEIQLREIKLAASRLAADSPSRPLFDFLLGYIEIINNELSTADEAVTKALEEIGIDPEAEFLADLDTLIELATEDKADAPILAVQL